jgi:hypothetical protein
MVFSSPRVLHVVISAFKSMYVVGRSLPVVRLSLSGLVVREFHNKSLRSSGPDFLFKKESKPFKQKNRKNENRN